MKGFHRADVNSNHQGISANETQVRFKYVGELRQPDYSHDVWGKMRFSSILQGSQGVREPPVSAGTAPKRDFAHHHFSASATEGSANW